MNTGLCDYELGSVLVFSGTNKNITFNIYTIGAIMIGWLLGNIIWWVGLIVIVLWLLQKCAI
tara:strand:+ start:79 stop:264 length:186 start_codon:yes stop_codon:yes gene_type:complete